MEKNMSIIEMINNLEAVCGEDLLVLDFNKIVNDAISEVAKDGTIDSTPWAYHALYDLDDAEDDGKFVTAKSFSALIGETLYQQLRDSAIHGIANHGKDHEVEARFRYYKEEVNSAISHAIEESNANVVLFYGDAPTMEKLKKSDFDDCFGELAMSMESYKFHLLDKSGISYTVAIYYMPGITDSGRITVERMLPILAEGYLSNSRNEDIGFNISNLTEMAVSYSESEAVRRSKRYTISAQDLIEFIKFSCKDGVNTIPVYIKQLADVYNDGILMHSAVRAYLYAHGMIDEVLTMSLSNGVCYEVSKRKEAKLIYGAATITGTLGDYIRLNNAFLEWDGVVFARAVIDEVSDAESEFDEIYRPDTDDDDYGYGDEDDEDDDDMEDTDDDEKDDD